MLDLDHFKSINDQFGHPRGDDALSAVGQVLRHGLRASDFAGRYGGEEFLVLLASTNRDGAQTIAEKIRMEIAAMAVPGLDCGITASIGIGLFPDDALDSDGIERAADRALYIAKNNGRNRVEVASTGGTASSSPTTPLAEPLNITMGPTC